MVSYLCRRFIPEAEQVEKPEVRRKYGMLCGGAGIALNLLLFLGKLLAGLLTGSIAVTADAFNNLSDAGSSIVTILGFRLSGLKPDPRHPFGHGRIEYLSGLIVSMFIILMGFELLKSSVGKILHPEPIAFSWLSVGILAAAILVKLYMARYNRTIGEKIRSSAMKATAADSLSDAVSTAAVLASTLVGRWFSWNIDGWAGLAVACFILHAGVSAAKDTIDPLLGQPPEPELVRHITETVLQFAPISGVHDLIIHDYGPGRMMISLHAEVPADGDLLELHDTVDLAEHRLQEVFGCSAVIHMDPIVTGDEAVNALHERVSEIVRQLNPAITIHDFRMVEGPTHTNLIFDAACPFSMGLDDREIERRIGQLIRKENENYHTVVTIDRVYTGGASETD